LAHIIATKQTSVVGSILVVFSMLVTIIVAIYLYREFKIFKEHHQATTTASRLEEGETEFEVALETEPDDRARLTSRRDSDDDVFFDEEDDIKH
jgi:hypothetical protein